MSKRKSEDSVEAEGPEKQRRRTRSSSDPLPNQTEEPEKREVLKRLFGRMVVLNAENNLAHNDAEDTDDDEEDIDDDVTDENDDPLLDGIPVDMDPEQLGFLLCAQETLRFLHKRGFTVENPTFALLRSRLLRGMQQIATA